MAIFAGKRVLITGGTGSLGKTLVRRILKGEHGLPERVTVFSRDEAKQHFLRLELLNRKTATDEIIYRNSQDRVYFRIGDVRSVNDVTLALKDADICVNAAALKQVPSCEYFPFQALQTNCLGAQNIVHSILENNLPVETVVGVSTDKACRPVNVMGMSKALQERIFIAANLETSRTRFVCVRYGNVLASRGSVVPLFLDQIRNGGPVTITHADMTRFLLSLEDAVDTVVAAISDARPGEIFIPICASAKMIDLAAAMIGNRKIETKVTGIRPGEKMHEALIAEEEALRTVVRGKFYAIGSMLPELASSLSASPAPTPALNAEYSSQHNPITVDQIFHLLSRHKVLVMDPTAEYSEVVG